MKFTDGSQASVMEQEKAQTQMAPGRGELSNARPVSRVNSTVNVCLAVGCSMSLILTVEQLPGPLEELGRGVIQPQFNPARPPKRAAPVESTDERFNGPSSKVAPSYMQVDSKRRKTNNEEDEVTESRQAMPPPMRQSTLRKVSFVCSVMFVDMLTSSRTSKTNPSSRKVIVSTTL